MFALKFKTKFDIKRPDVFKREVLRKIGDKPLTFVARDIRRDAMRSIHVRAKKEGPSAPGQPPKTRGARNVYQYMGGAGGTIFATINGKTIPVSRRGKFVGEQWVRHIEKKGGIIRSYRTPGKALRASIIYNVDVKNQRALIGPSGTAIGNLGRLHEFGGVGPAFQNEGRKYPARPFMRPALQKNLPSIAERWRTSLQ